MYSAPLCMELFAGGGGAALGLRRAGWRTLACVEADAHACSTLRAAGLPAVQAWIGHGGPDGLATFDPAPYYGAGLLWASPPCQPYSRAGMRRGADDARDGWPATLSAIRMIRAEWMVVENVVGAPVEEWRGQIRLLYPWTAVWRMDAADYGLPSHRQRVYLIAGPRPVAMPRPTHCGPDVPWLLRAGRRPWVSMAEALPHLAGFKFQCKATQPEGHDRVADRRERDLTDRPSPCIGAAYSGSLGGQPYVVEATITPGNGGNLPAPRTLDQPGHTVTSSSRMYHQPASHNTITRRRLTPEEVAALVGFPAGYPFRGTKGARYRQIGNAVAPVMAEVIGRAILLMEVAPDMLADFLGVNIPTLPLARTIPPR